MSAWPRYARHEEDFLLRSEEWKLRYGDKRVVFWDNTNLDFLGKPADPNAPHVLVILLWWQCCKGPRLFTTVWWLGEFERGQGQLF
jgi:hypothetical protein